MRRIPIASTFINGYVVAVRNRYTNVFLFSLLHVKMDKLFG